MIIKIRGEPVGIMTVEDAQRARKRLADEVAALLTGFEDAKAALFVRHLPRLEEISRDVERLNQFERERASSMFLSDMLDWARQTQGGDR